MPASSANQEGLDIRLAIHSQFDDLYMGEQDTWLMRIENHGDTAVAVPFGFPHPDEPSYFPPDQFHIQTWNEAQANVTPPLSPWDEIHKFGSGELVSADGDITMQRSMLDPGMAMESQTVYRSTRLRTPSEGGKFRVLMQVGENEFVYSNWIIRNRIKSAPPGMRTVADKIIRQGLTKIEFQISKSTQPRYLWYTTVDTSNIILNRICSISDRVTLDIDLDEDRHQFIISLSPDGDAGYFYGYRIGVTKTSPFPHQYRSSDLMLAPVPISEPSPLGFPLELMNSLDQDSHRITHDASKEHEGSQTDQLTGSGLNWLWISFISLFAIISILVRRMMKPPSRT